MNIRENDIENEIYTYVDAMKELLSPQIWDNILLDCSKNEVLVLWLLYRSGQANMSTIADYIHVPLNTATGIVARMEKKNLVIREHDREDKRVVIIRLHEKGARQIQQITEEVSYYAGQLIKELSAEEMTLFMQIMDKIKNIMVKGHPEESAEPQKIRRITIE